MKYRRMPIEIESPEQLGYGNIRNNLSESSYTDAFLRDIRFDANLNDLVLCYGSHLGHEGLRKLVADTLHPDDVLLTIGAAGALFIIATALLESGDEIIVVHPNYATNLETPRAIGATITPIHLRFEENFALDIDQIKISSKTKYISVTYPHNPTGVCLRQDELTRLIGLAERHNVRLLVDETYRDMTFAPPLPLAAALSPNVISVSSLSKTYGLPGLRTGWIICRDQQLMEQFLAAKEQIHICGPVLDEELSYQYLLNKQKLYQQIQNDIAEKFGITKEWINNQNDFEWVEPSGGCVCFPRLKHPERFDMASFYRILLEKYGTYVGPGHWFDLPDHYMRVGFGWPSIPQLKEGLNALSKTAGEAAK